MKRLIHITFTLFSTVFIPTHSLNSQVQYLFGYDAAGNRISRMGIILNKATQNVDTTGNILSDSSLYDNEAKQQYQANIDDYVITVYPNPTTGELKIDISNFEEGTKGSIFITDIQGKFIYKKDVIYDINTINLSNVASGQYLMRIVINNKNNEFFVL